MIGTRAPSTIPGGVRIGEERQALGEHVAGFEVRNDEHVRASGDRGYDLLDRRRLRADRIVERERPVEKRPRDLTPVRHLAQGGGLDRGRHLRRHRLHRAEDRHAHLGRAHRMREIDGVLDDVDLGVEVGGDVDRRVGDDERLAGVQARP